MEVAGYFAAILIGVSLGLIGGGGSILTVPVLVYLMGTSPVLATAYSLFIVGLSALIGAGNFMREKLVSYRTAIVFGIPSTLAVFATRKWVVPAIPDVIIEIPGLVLSKDLFIMLLFAVIMILASYSMIKSGKKKGGSAGDEDSTLEFKYLKITLEGIVVGFFTGLVGAGGGFLIIPALVLLAGLPMKLAVGTSLLIIAVKSLFGFLGDLGNQPIDWGFLMGFSILSIAGIFIGSFLNKKVSGANLKVGFGYFVLLMAVFVISKELLINRL